VGGVVLVFLYQFAWDSIALPRQFRRLFFANQTITLAFDEAGIRWCLAGMSATAEWRLGWSAILVEDHLVLVWKATRIGLAIPRRACASQADFAALTAYVVARVGKEAPGPP
jgi:hypothetical protein